MMNMIHIHPNDNVAVALTDVAKGEVIELKGITVTAAEDIKRGHKMALADLAKGDKIIKYGYPIGHASKAIKAGEWVHVHNVKTDLSEESDYKYVPNIPELQTQQPMDFQGFRRDDGRAAIRNEIWIIPTVGCVNSIAQRLVRENQHLVTGSVEGLYTFPHPFGCSQMGDDHAQTRKLLAALVRHPNAAGVLVLGLGCENLTLDQFKEELGEWDDNRVKFLICQDVEDEHAAGSALLAELAEYAGKFQREPIPVSELVVGMKCGGSDGLSGITANPTVGRFSDLLISMGGSTILTEVPEMFGAEQQLMDRADSPETFDRVVEMINSFKEYYLRHKQPIYENPSPGNRRGGITTLEEKSLGCIQKGGHAPVVDTLEMGQTCQKPGLSLMTGPGNDSVSVTNLLSSHAQLVLFTTGRGNPLGTAVPTVKIASNSALFQRKRNWMDFNAGRVLEHGSVGPAAEELWQLVLDAASGRRQTRNEENGDREIMIFKDGVIL